jgi:hypothetical protein
MAEQNMLNEPGLMFWVMLVNAMAFMPTIALSNTISYSSLAQAGLDTVTHFPPVRVYGTVGFIVAMWAISLAGVELSNVQLYIAAASSLLLAIYSLTLPAIPVAKSEAAPSLASKLGLNAFVLFKNPRMAVFFLFAMLLGAVLQITNTFGSPFLHDFAKNPEFSDSFLADSQNASDLIGGVSKSGDRYVDHTMFDMVQSLTITDSLKFGKAVLGKLGGVNKLHKNSVEQAGFAVLKAPDIPSILVETAFISNVEEERKLKTAKFQQEVAESILAGIKAYFADGATLARRG